MNVINRAYNIEEYIEPGKVVVIYGPRQVGKTTLVQEYLKSTQLKYKLILGDNLRMHQYFMQDLDVLKEFLAGYDLLVIDEAQKIPNIGANLKLIVDAIPRIRVIVTGSATFELAGQVGEPLVGRKWTLNLYPLAQGELLTSYTNKYELQQKLGDYLVYGTYPDVVTAPTHERRKTILRELTDSYLLKDILEFEGVKSPKLLFDLLKLIAFQIGGEVSLSELGRKLGIDRKTVERYLDLLEKSFIIYNVRGYSGNLRKEITRKSKYYFYDNGVRNAIIGNFNTIDDRDDIGQLWENFLIMERLKRNEYIKSFANIYFWRTWDKKEIDLIEERDGKLYGYEFKWSTHKPPKAPKDWLGTYNNATYEVITPENYLEFTTW